MIEMYQNSNNLSIRFKTPSTTMWNHSKSRMQSVSSVDSRGMKGLSIDSIVDVLKMEPGEVLRILEQAESLTEDLPDSKRLRFAFWGFNQHSFPNGWKPSMWANIDLFISTQVSVRFVRFVFSLKCFTFTDGLSRYFTQRYRLGTKQSRTIQKISSIL